MGRFDGKRILITGATSGIGLAGALSIAKEGGEVIGTGRDIGRIAEKNHSRMIVCNGLKMMLLS